MALNPYFQTHSYQPEQDMLADIIIESIKIYGQDMWYLPRTLVNYDDAVFGQDDMSEFNSAYEIEMYVKSVDGFGGEGSFLSKFGMEIRDRVSLSVARKRFTEAVGTPANLPRPREGDLLYFPMTKKVFELVYVDNRAQFYPMGSLPLFDLSCEVFEFNGEKFNTGVAEIDEIGSLYSLDRNSFADRDSSDHLVYDADNNVITIPGFDEEEQDVEFDNFKIEDGADDIVDFTELDPFTRGS